MSLLRLLVVFTVLAVLSSGRSLTATMIDDFSAGAFSIDVVRYETESVTLTNLPVSHVLGGSRFVTLNGLGPSPASSVRVAVDDPAGELRYDADAGATAANFIVQYGRTNGLQADLLADGSNAIVFDFANADFETGYGALDIFVGTEPGGRYLFVPVSNSTTPFSLVLPYRAFSTGASGANFANVTSIRFGTGNGNLRGDFRLTALHTAYFPDGDFNFDGSVDELDHALWRSHFGNAGPYGGAYPIDPADGNRNGIVDAADYVMWHKNLGATAGGAGITIGVPEPSAFGYALLALIGAIAFSSLRVGRSTRKCGRQASSIKFAN